MIQGGIIIEWDVVLEIIASIFSILDDPERFSLKTPEPFRRCELNIFYTLAKSRVKGELPATSVLCLVPTSSGGWLLELGSRDDDPILIEGGKK